MLPEFQGGRSLSYTKSENRHRMVFLPVAVLLVAIAGGCQSRKLIAETDEGAVSQNVIPIPQSQMILVVVGDVSMTETFISTVNLHDLSKGWVALKSEEKETCLLKPVRKNQGTGPQSSRIKGKDLFIKPATFYWRIESKALAYEEIVELAGEKLADFCAEYKTYVLGPKSAPVASRAFDSYEPELRKSNPQKRCLLFCWFNTPVLDVDEVDVVE